MHLTGRSHTIELSSSRGKEGTRNFLLELAQFVDVSPTTTESLRFAGSLEMKDFEDVASSGRPGLPR
jgi:hypothetical protein